MEDSMSKKKIPVLKPDKNGIVTLCGGGGCGCPKIDTNDPNIISITFDSGRTDSMTREEFQLLQNAYIPEPSNI
jgi:hypothetical protein